MLGSRGIVRRLLGVHGRWLLDRILGGLGEDRRLLGGRGKVWWRLLGGRLRFLVVQFLVVLCILQRQHLGAEIVCILHGGCREQMGAHPKERSGRWVFAPDRSWGGRRRDAEKDFRMLAAEFVREDGIFAFSDPLHVCKEHFIFDKFLDRRPSLQLQTPLPGECVFLGMSILPIIHKRSSLPNDFRVSEDVVVARRVKVGCCGPDILRDLLSMDSYKDFHAKVVRETVHLQIDFYVPRCEYTWVITGNCL